MTSLPQQQNEVPGVEDVLEGLIEQIENAEGEGDEDIPIDPETDKELTGYKLLQWEADQLGEGGARQRKANQSEGELLDVLQGLYFKNEDWFDAIILEEDVPSLTDERRRFLLDYIRTNNMTLDDLNTKLSDIGEYQDWLKGYVQKEDLDEGEDGDDDDFDEDKFQQVVEDLGDSTDFSKVGPAIVLFFNNLLETTYDPLKDTTEGKITAPTIAVVESTYKKNSDWFFQLAGYYGYEDELSKLEKEGADLARLSNAFLSSWVEGRPEGGYADGHGLTFNVSEMGGWSKEDMEQYELEGLRAWFEWYTVERLEEDVDEEGNDFSDFMKQLKSDNPTYYEKVKDAKSLKEVRAIANDDSDSSFKDYVNQNLPVDDGDEDVVIEDEEQEPVGPTQGELLNAFILDAMKEDNKNLGPRKKAYNAKKKAASDALKAEGLKGKDLKQRLDAMDFGPVPNAELTSAILQKIIPVIPKVVDREKIALEAILGGLTLEKAQARAVSVDKSFVAMWKPPGAPKKKRAAAKKSKKIEESDDESDFGSGDEESWSDEEEDPEEALEKCRENYKKLEKERDELLAKVVSLQTEIKRLKYETRPSEMENHLSQKRQRDESNLVPERHPMKIIRSSPAVHDGHTGSGVTNSMVYIPEQWEARLDLFMSLKESVDGLKYLDFDVGDDLADKAVAVDILNYLDSLCEQQCKIINYLKAAYEVDQGDSDAITEALTAINLGDTDCPKSIPDPENPNVLLTEKSPRFNDKFFYARKHLILHFTKHANWRVFCRSGKGLNGGVTYKNAIIAAVYGKQIETNLYWDPHTNVAVALYGPVYDPEADYSSGDMIQKVLTVFDRTNERALRAYKGYMQLLNIERKARRYDNCPGYEKPEQLSRFDPNRPKKNELRGTTAWFTKMAVRFQPPSPFTDIINYTRSDIPEGVGRSTARQTPEELEEFNRSSNAYKPRRIWDLRIQGRYNFDVMYSPEGTVVDAEDAQYLSDISDAKQRFAEIGVERKQLEVEEKKTIQELGLMRQEDVASITFNKTERAKEEAKKLKEERRKIQEENMRKNQQKEKGRKEKEKEEKERLSMAMEDRRTIDLMNARRAKDAEERERLEQEKQAQRKAQQQKDKAAAAERKAAKQAEEAKIKAAQLDAKKAKQEAEKAKRRAKRQKKKSKKKNAAKEDEDFDALLAEFADTSGEYLIENDKGEVCISSSEDGSCSEDEEN